MASFHHTIVVSPIGTSLLTNDAPPEMRLLLNKAANLKENEIAPEERQRIEARIEDVTYKSRGASNSDMKRMSAELNGILSMEASGNQFSHYLICTDTYQGRATGQIVQERLKELGARDVQLFTPAGLCTSSQERFSQGVDEILRWMDTVLSPYKESGYRVVFNLVGGFKSILAYLQTLGMVYADEMCYVFEDQTTLIRIPRLPIVFDREPLERNKTIMALLATGRISAPKEDVAGLPEAYWLLIDGEACLSHWGALAWNAEKASILGGNLIEHEGLEFAESFVRDYKRCQDVGKRVRLQEILAETAILWKQGGLGSLRADGAIQYETYQNKGGVGHFRLNSGDRVSCLPDGNRMVLRHYGAHDYVNDNP